MLDDSTLRKVKALVEMTRSDSDNECLLAIRHAHRLAKQGGMSLVEVLQHGAAASIDLERLTKAMAEEFERGKQAGIKETLYKKQTITPPASVTDLPWKPMQQLCAIHRELLNSREVKFIEDIERFVNITTKQYSWLNAIYTRVKVCAVPQSNGPRPAAL